MVMPFLLYVNKKKLEAREDLVRYYSLKRDRNLILFWSAQVSEVKNSLAPEIARHIASNSAADISLQMHVKKQFFNSSNDQIDNNNINLIERLAHIIKTTH